ncbi:MAG: hypothetical protein ACJAZ1_002417 [Yoonia sp.]|jgi:hypothetical protein
MTLFRLREMRPARQSLCLQRKFFGNKKFEGAL